MCKRIRQFVLIGAISSCISVAGYAADKNNYDYQQPNYNDPSKPNYMGGTRTDMAPNVEIPNNENKEKEKICEPSERVKKEFNRLEDQRGSEAEIILFPDTVSSHKRLQEDWDKECKEKEGNKNRYPSQSSINPDE